MFVHLSSGIHAYLCFFIVLVVASHSPPYLMLLERHRSYHEFGVGKCHYLVALLFAVLFLSMFELQFG